MPTKYTLEQVKNIFEQNKCLLTTETYNNQLDKLNYVASCGHNNTICLKLFPCCPGIVHVYGKSGV